jgi:hypothetical protein
MKCYKATVSEVCVCVWKLFPTIWLGDRISLEPAENRIIVETSNNVCKSDTALTFLCVPFLN